MVVLLYLANRRSEKNCGEHNTEEKSQQPINCITSYYRFFKAQRTAKNNTDMKIINNVYRQQIYENKKLFKTNA